MINSPGANLSDPLPWSDALTAYDEANLVTYLRLLDAEAAGAPDAEICRVVFDLDIHADRERATRILQDHLKRARWMTERGYVHLLSTDQPSSAR
jgi:hypothetical protein